MIPAVGAGILVVVVLSAAGCAPVPPEREERDRVLTSAVEPCTRQYPGSRLKSIDRHGRIEAQVEDFRDLEGFRQCVKQALARSPQARLATGQLAAHAARASVKIQTRGPAILVPALVNGVNATLLLDTGAGFTIIRPDLARRAGIEPAWEARRVRVTVAGGGQLSVPLVRARSLGINDAAVEAIDVGVYDALPNLPDVDGVLGGNFLNHFRLTIDRQRRLLILVPLRPPKPS
jgi:predicted aspartyl protease